MNETMILKTGLFASSPGVFTVIGGDEWGDLEVAHFYVGAATIQMTNSSETCTPAITLTQTSPGAALGATKRSLRVDPAVLIRADG